MSRREAKTNPLRGVSGINPDIAEHFAISPWFTATKLIRATLDDKIDVFEDRMRGWLLNHARALTVASYRYRDHSGLAVLMLSSAYFEAIASYILGRPGKRGDSQNLFVCGFDDVFPGIRATARTLDAERVDVLVKRFIGTFYHELRCGLFHDAETRSKVIIKPDNRSAVKVVVEPGTFEIATIVISPSMFLARIEAHFARYIAKIRDPRERKARVKFESRFDADNGKEPIVMEHWIDK